MNMGGESHDFRVFIFLHIAFLVEAQYQQVIRLNMLPDIFLSTLGLYLVTNQNKIVLLMSPLTAKFKMPKSTASIYILVIHL